jgi:hypothetical protein
LEFRPRVAGEVSAGYLARAYEDFSPHLHHDSGNAAQGRVPPGTANIQYSRNDYWAHIWMLGLRLQR